MGNRETTQRIRDETGTWSHRVSFSTSRRYVGIIYKRFPEYKLDRRDMERAKFNPLAYEPMRGRHGINHDYEELVQGLVPVEIPDMPVIDQEEQIIDIPLLSPCDYSFGIPDMIIPSKIAVNRRGALPSWRQEVMVVHDGKIIFFNNNIGEAGTMIIDEELETIIIPVLPKSRVGWVFEVYSLKTGLLLHKITSNEAVVQRAFRALNHLISVHGMSFAFCDGISSRTLLLSFVAPKDLQGNDVYQIVSEQPKLHQEDDITGGLLSANRRGHISNPSLVCSVDIEDNNKIYFSDYDYMYVMSRDNGQLTLFIGPPLRQVYSIMDRFIFGKKGHVICADYKVVIDYDVDKLEPRKLTKLNRDDLSFIAYPDENGDSCIVLSADFTNQMPAIHREVFPIYPELP